MEVSVAGARATLHRAATHPRHLTDPPALAVLRKRRQQESRRVKRQRRMPAARDGLLDYRLAPPRRAVPDADASIERPGCKEPAVVGEDRRLDGVGVARETLQ